MKMISSNRQAFMISMDERDGRVDFCAVTSKQYVG